MNGWSIVQSRDLFFGNYITSLTFSAMRSKTGSHWSEDPAAGAIPTADLTTEDKKKTILVTATYVAPFATHAVRVYRELRHCVLG